jgi:cob(I)alamin adenosyltransferase
MVLAVSELPTAVTECLTDIQHELFDLGGELSVPGFRAISADHVTRLELQLDAFNEDSKICRR